MQPQPDIEPLCTAFARGLEAVLGDKLHGVYLYGSLTFPEGRAGGDIDYHVIIREPPTDEESTGLRDLKAALDEEFGQPAWDMDGYYILLADAQRAAPPPHQLLPGIIDKAWALHRAHIRAGRHIVLHGPDPREIYPAASWPELEAALWNEVDWIEKHLTEYPDLGVLNLCRLMYSFQTRDVVVSKRFAADWAEANYAQWSPLIDLARKSYDRGHQEDDRVLLAAQIPPFYDFAMQHIHASLARQLSEGEAS